MNHLRDHELFQLSSSSVRRSSSTSVLEGVRVLAFYFSAHWCPPCRQFTPRLADAHRGRDDRRAVRVVFVSSDRSENEQIDYMRQMHDEWPALSVNDPLSESLKRLYGVRGIPALIVVNAHDGSLITDDGRKDVLTLGPAAFNQWLSMAANPIDLSVVSMLSENDAELLKEAGTILMKLISNVLRDPNNLKYRSIRLSNPTIESKLLSAHGAFEILFSIGFEEGEDSLILPLSANLTVLEDFKKEIERVMKKGRSSNDSKANSRISSSNNPNSNNDSGTSTGRASNSTNNAATTTSLEGASKSSSVTSKTAELELLSKLEMERTLALSYEDKDAQTKAREAVPVDQLRAKAQSKLQVLQSQDQTIGPERLQDLLLLELLKWFREDFFTWMDAPRCPDCQVASVYVSTVSGSGQEASDGASRVEMYTCPSCPRVSRFPRYHFKPSKLLDTREGRCGEFANCFALILRSLDFDVRRVLDVTDHVWVEVFSQAEKRWLHADPCEGVCDQPLLYEAGWGKRLSYVLAASKDEVQDVSWRYSINHSDLKLRRTLVNEQWLNSQLLRLTELNMRHMKDEERERIVRRRLVELVELMSTKSEEQLNKAKSLQGRQSGSLAWRLARGEIGNALAFQPFTWTLNDKERSGKEFWLEYDVVHDVYRRLSGSNEDGIVVNGWEKGVKACENVIRKYENDWGYFYLARTEGSERSTLGWELNLSDSNLSVKSIELYVSSSVFESGRVLWQLCGNSICLLPSSGKVMQSDALNGAKSITLTATMSGGKGDVAWQHTQIFRTHKSEKQGHQLRIKVTLKNDA